MKNLPIHIVKFRGDRDKFLTEGMGDKKRAKMDDIRKYS